MVQFKQQTVCVFLQSGWESGCFCQNYCLFLPKFIKFIKSLFALLLKSTVLWGLKVLYSLQEEYHLAQERGDVWKDVNNIWLRAHVMPTQLNQYLQNQAIASPEQIGKQCPRKLIVTVHRGWTCEWQHM